MESFLVGFAIFTLGWMFGGIVPPLSMRSLTPKQLLTTFAIGWTLGYLLVDILRRLF